MSNMNYKREEDMKRLSFILDQVKNHGNGAMRILDVGCGVGNITMALASKGHAVTGIDISKEALEVAKSNAIKNNVDIEFIKLDILSPFDSSLITHHLSLIVSNPPYVLNSEAKQMDARVLEHEPHLALFVKDTDPIIFYKRIIDLCTKHLEEKGYLFFELNPMYANDVKKYANDSKIFNFTEIVKDMSGKERFLKAQKK